MGLMEHLELYLHALHIQTYHRINELCNSMCCFVGKGGCFGPLREVVGKGDDVLIPSWCLWHWPYQVHPNLMPDPRFNWNRVEPPNSLLLFR